MTSPIGPDARPSTPLNGVVRGACPHDCPDTCAMLVTVEDGRATRVAGDPEHPFTRGFLCAKVNRYVERTYHHDRLRYAAAAHRAQGKRSLRARSPGTMRSARSPTGCTRSPSRATGRRRSCRTPTRARWACSRARRWIDASSTSSAPRCSIARSARWPERSGMRMTVGANIGADAEGIPAERSRAAVGDQHADREPASVAVRPRGARARRADHLHRSDPHAHRGAVRRVDRRSARARTPRWRSG